MTFIEVSFLVSRLFLFTLFFISWSCVSTAGAIHELYTYFEHEYANICYTPSFEAVNRTKQLAKVIRDNLLDVENPEKSNFKKLDYQAQLPAYENAVLVSMVKDEEDIIFENLCWHYFMGFRKFIIVDNGSTDNTGQLIDKFKGLTKSSAVVIKIDDPEVSFKQASRINACCRLAEILFPEITWIFPNDADEFIIFDKSIEETLSKVPRSVNCIYSPRLWYVAKDDYFSFPSGTKFYESIYSLHKVNPFIPQTGKTFIKAHQGLFVVRGSHFVSLGCPMWQHYIAGLKCNVHIREFPVRSPEQVIKKFINRSKALKVLENTYSFEAGNLVFNASLHSKADRYAEVGDKYGWEEFKSSMEKGLYSFEEHMPIELALNWVDLFFYGAKK